MQALQFLTDCFHKAVAAARPEDALRARLPTPPWHGRTRVLAVGKAAASMAACVEAAWPSDAPLDGVVVVPEGAVQPPLQRLRYVQGSHPVPSLQSARAAEALLAAAAGLTADDLVLALVSGGASALACAPLPGLSLDEKQGIHRALLASGAPIQSMNVLRKHLSCLKGGRLALACAPARVCTFLVSDIPGDTLDLIGSGPTLADPSSCADALRVARQHGIALPAAAEQALARGDWETPKPGDPRWPPGEVHLLTSPGLALQAAAAHAQAQGITPYVLGDALEGEACEVGAQLGSLALEAARGSARFRPPCVLLSGGETTVTLGAAPPGQGGRNAETLLACWMQVLGQPEAARIHALMADTDGIDGLGPGAGAWFGPTLGAEAAGASQADLVQTLREALARHDAGGAFQRLGQALVTGPTGTNVNDFRALLIGV